MPRIFGISNPLIKSNNNFSEEKLKRLHITSSELICGKLGEIYYKHLKKTDSSSAFTIDEGVEMEIFIPRSLGVISLKVDIFNEGCNELINTYFATLNKTQSGYDIYSIALKKRELAPALYFYNITAVTAIGDVYIKRCGDKICFSDKNADLFQLSVSDFSSEEDSSFAGGIIYHIFVDRFSKDKNVNPKKGTVIADNWDTMPEYPEYPGAFLRNNTFYGGTLNSAAKRLDYIKSLGVSIIYLSPVFDSPSNHKYDTADYMNVDSMFGGDDALLSFVKKAKKRGISVILDGVFNHTGADSVYFNRYGNYPSLGAYQSKKSQYYDWYTFRSHPDDYESWWGIEILPRINTGNKDFESFILNSVIKKYRSFGIAGLRLDVADELSDDFIKRIKAALSEQGENILYGEVWEDASNKIAYGKRKSYYLGGELDGVMNYPLRSGLIDFFKSRSSDKLRFALTDIINNAPKRIRDLQMNILGTHDTERILTALGAESADGKSNKELSVMRMSANERERAEQLLISAYTVLATLPGIPAIFYGDEAGLEGYSDPFNRMPYPKNVSKKLLNAYKKIGQIRNDNSVYADGGYKLIILTNELLAFSRNRGAHYYITFCNNSDAEIEIEFSEKADELLSKARSDIHIIPKNSTFIFKTRAEEFSVLTKQEIIK